MRGRQVVIVLVALIAVGMAGLIVRVASSSSDERVLSGLLPLAQDVVDRVTISSDQSEAELVRIGDTWRVGTHDAFPFKLGLFWLRVSDIDGAQLIATNPASHERMGVANDQGTTVSFFVGQIKQDQFLVGKWAPEVGLCYLRRSGKDEVYGIPCPERAPFIFDPDPDGWRDPLVALIPREEVESLTFAYPDEEFVLKLIDGRWVVANGEGEQPADPFQVDIALRVLESAVMAIGFADEDEAEGLKFDTPDASVRIVTIEGATSPTTRLRFLERDAFSYYVRIPTEPTVFIVDRDFADGLLKRKEDFLAAGGG